MAVSIINLSDGVKVTLHPDNRRIVMEFPTDEAYRIFNDALNEAVKPEAERYQENLAKHPELVNSPTAISSE